MRTLLRSLLFVFLALSTRSKSVEILTIRQDPAVSIQVPVPDGYASVPSTTQEFKVMQSQFAAGGNELLSLFFVSSRTGTDDDFMRQLSVQCHKDNKGFNATKATLDAIRRNMEQQKKELEKKVGAKFGLTGVSFEPVHEFSDRHFSMVVHVPSQLPAQEGAKVSTVVTAAILRGRLWYFGVRSEKDGPGELEWAKSTAKSWYASILAASPSDAETLAREERSGKSLFDGVGRAGIVGAVAGGIGALIAVIYAKRKKTDPPA